MDKETKERLDAIDIESFLESGQELDELKDKLKEITGDFWLFDGATDDEFAEYIKSRYPNWTYCDEVIIKYYLIPRGSAYGVNS